MRLLGPTFVKPQNPSRGLHMYPIPETTQSHASFLYETSYFGLMRQPYLVRLVRLWQLDLERAETAEVPR